MQVTKRTVLYAIVIVILLLLALRPKTLDNIITGAPEKFPSIPVVNYNPGDVTVDPYNGDTRNPWDWFGPCHCDGLTSGATPTIINSVRLGAAPLSGYRFISQPDLSLPKALKGGVGDLGKYPPVPAPIIYEAARPTFWWGWKDFYRVIFTSDGAVLKSGMENRLWFRADGIETNSALSGITPITAIRYNGQVYTLR